MCARKGNSKPPNGNISKGYKQSVHRKRKMANKHKDMFNFTSNQRYGN